MSDCGEYHCHGNASLNPFVGHCLVFIGKLPATRGAWVIIGYALGIRHAVLLLECLSVTLMHTGNN